MKNYLDLCQKIVDEGIWKENRTGIRTLGIIGESLTFDLREGFPVVTTKKFAEQSCFAELLSILRGHSSAKDFRKTGTKVWDANANESKHWLANPNRQGEDDLGRIYGVQARNWEHTDRNGVVRIIDQLRNVVKDLEQGIDNRREIVTMWNPGEMDQMSLPPCHLLYQFHIHGETLCLTMYQRSADFPLGVPYNIAGYAWLLCCIAKICNLVPGKLTMNFGDCHIYENQLDIMKDVQLKREPYEQFVRLELKDGIDFNSLSDLENDRPEHGYVIKASDFYLDNYQHHDVIKYPFAC